MARRVAYRNRWGVITTAAGIFAAGAAITGGVILSGGSTPDTLAPSLFLTAPAAGSTVSGTTTISATCGDNVGCAGVQFKVNGANLGAEDTSAPFSISWPTGDVAGTYTLSAVARDTAGNTKTSSSVSAIVSPPGPVNVANLFIDSNGGTCTRHATPATYVDAEACSSFATAYAAASVGDSVLIESGTYAGETLVYTAAKADGLGTCDYMAGMTTTASTVTPNYSGCITFQPASGASVTSNGLSIEVDYIRLKNLTINGGLNFGLNSPSNGVLCSAMRQHDLVADGITITNGSFTIKADHASIINSTLNIGDALAGGRTDTGTSHFNTCIGVSGGVNTYQNGSFQAIVNSTIENLIAPQIRDQTGCSGANCMHVAAVHLEAGNHVLIDRDKFENNGGHNLEPEAEGSNGGASNDWRITNNFFDTICSHQTLNVDASPGIEFRANYTSGSTTVTFTTGTTGGLSIGEPIISLWLPANTTIASIVNSTTVTVSAAATSTKGSSNTGINGTCEDQGGDTVNSQGDALSNVVYSFNTFLTGAPVWAANFFGGTTTGTLQSIGNVSGGAAPPTGSSSTAGTCSNLTSTRGITLDYNVYASGTACGAHDLIGAVSFLSSATADLHLTGGAGLADNLVPNTGGNCPTHDIDGDIRSNPSCDAGADER